VPVAIVLVIGGGMYLIGHTDIWEPANLGGLPACEVVRGDVNENGILRPTGDLGPDASC
jgi:hypothetical protein